MSELRTFLQESLSGLRLEMSKTTQAQMTIPTGTVRNVCQTFEDRISAHMYERDSVYICRAARNVEELVRQNRTYAEQLRVVENATLFNLPAYLVDFLRDHNNLYRAAFRSRSTARKARASPHMDVLERVTCRLQNIRNAYYLNMIEMTHSPIERRRLMHEPLFIDGFNECTVSLQDEIFRQLTRFEQLLPSPAEDIELANVGSDHTVDDFRQEVSSTIATTASDDRDPSLRCCICLELYTPQHPAFTMAQCNHIVGKPCLAQWLNSNSLNANLCPHCRTPLCKRRTRRPAGMTPATLNQQRSISERLGRAIIMIGRVERLHYELFGAESAVEYTKKATDDLNYRLFEHDVGFCLECEGTAAGTLGFRRVRWH